jgi:phosphohistidine phosphatase
MSELYLLRHAKAMPQNEPVADRDRPLEERGRKGARAIAQWIGDRGLEPELVLCSPATRTRETLELIVGSFARQPDIRYEGELYVADAGRLLERLRELPGSVRRVMLIGHNPGLHELAQSLADSTADPLGQRLASGLPTAGLARFEIETEWASLRRRSARLVAMVSPRDFGD